MVRENEVGLFNKVIRLNNMVSINAAVIFMEGAAYNCCHHYAGDLRFFEVFRVIKHCALHK